MWREPGLLFGGGRAFGHGDLLLRDLLAQLAMLLDCLALAEVLKLKHLADLDLALPLVRVGAAFDQLDRFLLGLDLEDPVAGDQLLGFCERAVDHGALVTREPDTRALPSSIRPVFTISSLNFAM